MKYTRSLLLSLLLAAAPAALSAQGAPAAGARPAAPAQQAGGRIHGTVLSASTGKPVASASVAVRNAADSTLVTGALTRPDGTFQIAGLKPGRYSVRISALGFTPVTKSGVSLTQTSLQAELGSTRLATSAVQIEGLAVAGQKREVALAPDRNSYEVKTMPVTQGGTAVDVLRNVPSVEVDGDNNVSLRGNQNVVVQINGRPTPVTAAQLGNFLAQLPADMVQRVEVIPNPSAKYDPEGMAGIINIALKENTDLGLSGGLTTGGGSTGQVNGSGNVGYQKGALTLFGSYGFLHNERKGSGFNNLASYDANATPTFFREQDITTSQAGRSHTVNARAEYSLSRSNALSTNLVVSKRDDSDNNLNLYRVLDPTRSLTGLSNQLNYGTGNDLTVDYTLGYKRVVKPRANELETELRYTRDNNLDTSRFTAQALTLQGAPANSTPALERNDPSSHRNNLTFQSDLTRALGSKTKVEAGYKGTLRQLNSDLAVSQFSYAQGVYVPDLARTNTFSYDEQVHSFYGVLSQSVSKFDLQGGLRMEEALTQFNQAAAGGKYKNNYGSYFPSALVAFNVDDARQLKVSYSKRITRPDTRQLNPIERREDALNLSIGNPSLKPQYTHAFEAGFQQSGHLGSLQVNPFYRHTVNAVRRIRSVDANGVTTNTFANVATSDSYGSDVTGSLRLGHLSGFAGTSLYKQVTDGSNLSTNVSNNSFGWTARANATYQLTPATTLQTFYMYRAAMNVEQGRNSAQSMVNLGLRQTLNDRANLTLRVADPFNQAVFTFTSTDPRLQQVTERRQGMRGVYLTFSYNFGAQPKIRGSAPQDPPQDDTGN